MRRLVGMLTMLLAAAAAAAEPAAPGDLSIDGPTKAVVAQEVRLIVQGLPELDPSQPLAAGLIWVDTIRVETSAPAPGNHTLTRRLGLSFAPIAWQLELVFTAADPGDYVVVIDWNQPPYGLTLHRLTVSGLGPQPPPLPPPPPGPGPPDPPQPPPSPSETTGVAWLIVIRPEQPTADQFADLLKLRVWVDSQPPGKVELLEFTRDQRDSSGGVDAKAAGYVALVPAGETLPFVFLVQKLASGGTHKHWTGKLSGNHDAIIDRAKGAMK